MKTMLLFLLVIPFVLISCTSATTTSSSSGYEPTLINASEGKTMLDSNTEIILVDVRTESEFLESHIPGAILLPVDDVATLAATEIPNQSAIYIIYCRSGNRSNTAANLLTDMGYAFIYDMGGIIYWPYDTVSGTE